MATATATEKIPVLSVEAAAEYDRYNEKRRSKSKAEGTARRAKAEMDTALKAVRAEMGEQSLARLPDGRTIVARQHTRHRRAQPASEYGWWELDEV